MIKETTTVYSCEACGKEFLKSKSCKAHEVRCVKKQEADKKKADERDAICNFIRLNCDSVQKIGNMIVQHVNTHLGGDLRFTSVSIRGLNNYDNREYISLRVEGSWKNPPKRNRFKGDSCEAYFGDIFGRWGDVDYPIKGIDTGSGGGGQNSFGYELKVFIDQFPLLKAKQKKLDKLLHQRKVYIAEEGRLDKVRHDYVANLSVVDPDMITLKSRLCEVIDQIDLLKKEHENLRKAVEQRDKALHEQALKEEPELLRPGKKFQYDEKAYFDCRDSLGLPGS